MLIKESGSLTSTNHKLFEVRLASIVAFLKKNRLSILAGALIGAILGSLYALSKPNEYTSHLTVMPEIQGKGIGNLVGLSSLAGLAGVDVGGLTSSTEAIRPDLYPNIVQSISFGLHMLKQPVYSRLFNKQESLQNFLLDQQAGTWRGRLANSLSLFSNSSDDKPTVISKVDHGQLELSKQDEGLILALQGRISVVHDKKSGIVTVETMMPDPVVAASTAQSTLNYLTTYITSYRTEKARNQVQFLVNQVDKAKRRYREAEYALSSYRDQNRNLYLNTAKIDEQRLQADFILSQNIYDDLAKQLELARIRIQEDTPVFKVLESARVPRQKSAPKRTFIALGFSALGAIVTVLFLLYKQWRSS